MNLDEQFTEYFDKEDRKVFEQLVDATTRGLTSGNSIKEFAKDLFDSYMAMEETYTRDPGSTWRHAVARATSHRIDRSSYIAANIGDCAWGIYDIVREGVDAAADDSIWRTHES